MKPDNIEKTVTCYPFCLVGEGFSAHERGDILDIVVAHFFSRPMRFRSRHHFSLAKPPEVGRVPPANLSLNIDLFQ